MWSYLAERPPPHINHRFIQDHYTDYISHIDVCRDTSADRPHSLLQSIIDLWKTTTLWQFHGTLTLAPLLQSTIDLCKTITPNKFHIYNRMHIVLIFGRWTPKSSIDL